MFTGIIAAVGKIKNLQSLGDDEHSGLKLRIDAGDLTLQNTKLGDSIAIQGACMTVVAFDIDQNTFDVDVSRESLDRTAGLDKLAEVNLEHALRMGDSLDGHLVSGHVDGIGQVTCMDPVGESIDFRVIVPAHLSKYMAYKGSVTVNGVSLTVNRVDDQEEGAEIAINLIPHTVQVTTLRNLNVGDAVNLEIDLIARYVERMVDNHKVC